MGQGSARVKIFVCCEHHFESIATEIQNGLEGPDIEVLRLPFRSQRDHDEVIKESLEEGVGAADAVVVVPGADP